MGDLGPDTVAFSHDRPYPEVLGAEHQPPGVPAAPCQAEREPGTARLKPGPGTSKLASAAAKAKAEAWHFKRLLGLQTLPEGHPYAPYVQLASQWRNAHTRQLAANVGGGEVGAAPASIVSSAALQLAASRYLFDLGAQTGDAKTLLDASKLADASRQNLLAASHLAAREAAARPRSPQAFPWLATPPHEPSD